MKLCAKFERKPAIRGGVIVILFFTLGAFFFDGPGPGLARARVQPFFFTAPAGPGGPKLARPLPAAVIGHAHLPRFSYLQMASASDVDGKMIIVS